MFDFDRNLGKQPPPTEIDIFFRFVILSTVFYLSGFPQISGGLTSFSRK